MRPFSTRCVGCGRGSFDKGRSLMPLTLASGGDHYGIGGDRAGGNSGEGASLSCCPLGELSTDGDKAWAADWLEMLVALQGVAITPDHRDAIARQVNLMAEAPGRSLSDFMSGVQMREIKDAPRVQRAGRHSNFAESRHFHFTAITSMIRIIKIMELTDVNDNPCLPLLEMPSSSARIQIAKAEPSAHPLRDGRV